MDSGYFDDDIITTIELAGCQYLIKGKEYPTLASQVTAPTISFTKGEEGRETTQLVTKLGTWDKIQLMMLSYNLFLLFKLEFLGISEYNYCRRGISILHFYQFL